LCVAPCSDTVATAAVAQAQAASASPSSSKFSLAAMQAALGLPARLAARTEATPDEFAAALHAREVMYGKRHVVPTGSLEHVGRGAWHLTGIDAKAHRTYARKV
jgi:hypothetical protein